MNDSVRMKPRSSVLAELNNLADARKPETEASDDGPNALERSDPLPRPGDAYMAHARRSAKPQMTLFLVQRNYLPEGYSYANLEQVWLEESDKPGSGPVLKLRFYGSRVTEMAIEGRNLYPLCNAIGMHLMPWLWEHPSPKDFTDDEKTVIRKISFDHLEP